MHAAQLRRREDEIAAAGARIVAIGTGDVRYARAFIEQEHIDVLVLLDEDGTAADAAKVKTGGLMELVGPRSVGYGALAFFKGKRQHRTGRRPTQLGATFVIGPGNRIRYEHLDDDVADHALFEDVLAAIKGGTA